MAVQPNIVPPTAPSAPGTATAGPNISGNHFGQNAFGIGPNQGLSVLMQHVTLNQNSTTAVSVTAYLPKHSVISDILVDTPTAWNSATSANVTVGTAAAGTQYAGGAVLAPAAVSVLAAGGGRQRFAFTAAQVNTLLDTGSNEAVVVTITPVGATTAGQSVVTLLYEQTINWQNP